MKTKILILVLVFGSRYGASQVLYADPATVISMKAYENMLKKQQQKTIDEQSKLQKAQAWVATQMTAANKLQEKIYKGLSEVSGTLQNGIQVKQIYYNLDQCKNYSVSIGKLVKTHPQYAVFAKSASKKTYEQTVKIGTDVSSLLAGGELNLMTAGDRYKLLDKINHNVMMLKIWLLQMHMDMERAIRVGFWKSINPFQTYINTDRNIIENVMDRWRYNF